MDFFSILLNTLISGGSGGGSGTEEIETLIDNSGVLDSTEGTVSEKVEGLIDKAEELDIFMNITNAEKIFQYAENFPTKAVVNLPNATKTSHTFADWNVESIPIVEEITVNAPKSENMSGMFLSNKSVKKVVLNGLDSCKYISALFQHATVLEEVVLNFSTKNVTDYHSAFLNCNKLKKIIGVLDFSSATRPGAFYNCSDLEEVRFADNTLSLSIAFTGSKKLSANSIQSIIDGLKPLEEGATAQTLTLDKNIVLTDEQKATIEEKGWTLVQ